MHLTLADNQDISMWYANLFYIYHVYWKIFVNRKIQSISVMWNVELHQIWLILLIYFRASIGQTMNQQTI